MQIDLKGRSAMLLGHRHAIAEAVAAALGANGATITRDGAADLPALLIVSHPLEPMADYDPAPLLKQTAAVAAGMATGGRIVHLVSAAGLIAMRRHPDYSAAMAAIVASVRALAMTAAPRLSVNAVAAGRVDTAGDAAMLSHVPTGLPGTAADIVHAALFLADPMNSYTTGQILAVDGGWSAGYGRHF